MNELVAIVAQRTGLSPEDAQKAVEAVIQVLRERLPGPIASHLDAILAGDLSSIAAETGGFLKAALDELSRRRKPE